MQYVFRNVCMRKKKKFSQVPIEKKTETST